jgi:hypothetical protein
MMSLAGELEDALGGWHEIYQHALILLHKTFSMPHDTPTVFVLYAFVILNSGICSSCGLGICYRK